MKKRFESGQSLMEYSLAIVLIAVLVMATVYFLGPATSNMFVTIIDKF